MHRSRADQRQLIIYLLQQQETSVVNKQAVLRSVSHNSFVVFCSLRLKGFVHLNGSTHKLCTVGKTNLHVVTFGDARFYARVVQLANWGALTRIILSGILLSKL